VSEFTGERVIPGQVNDDLWAEHVARYAFAARFAAGERVLDAGCGTGYGACELARAGGFVTGIDVDYGAVHFRLAAGRGEDSAVFVQATAAAMPFRDACFDLITAFEVIEHLEDWRGLLRESRRVLDSHGMFLVSTPNKLYYAETRAREGPNPYHVHEFEFEEFQAALCEFFPHVQILFQNRMESIGFHAEITKPIEIRIDKSAPVAETAHFFLGVCGVERIPDLQTFIYVPRAANVLREREQHIRKLEQELAQTKKWLDQQIADHATLQREHEQLNQHLAEKNRWALELEENWKASQARILELQKELEEQQHAAQEMAAGYERQVADLDKENRKKTQWALETEERLTAEVAVKARQLAETVQLLDRAEATVIERTEWAQRLDAELNQVKAILNMVKDSRWLRLGRTAGLGPKL